MEQLNFAPFYEYQKVVCLKDYSPFGNKILAKKGVVYVVKQVKKFCNCGVWVVDIGLINEKGKSHCPDCSHEEQASSIWIVAHFFAPIKENFQSISLEKVLEEETKFISVN